MAKLDNHHVQAEKQHVASEYERGMQDGYDNAAKPLPSWWYSRTPAMMTAYQRGYFMGVLLRQEEGFDHA